MSVYAQQARWTLCGLSLCVDAFTRLDTNSCAKLAAGPDKARALGAELQRRAAAGIGGEVRFDWHDGPAWLDAHLPMRIALGGTPAHAARLLTRLGAPALLALEHRTPEQLAVLDPDMLLAAEAPVRAAEVAATGQDRSRVYVFEYTAHEEIGGIVPPRSSRIIVRFHDFDLEQDSDFTRLSPELLRDCVGQGSGIVSGFSSLGGGPRLDAGITYARALAASWQAAGIGTIHFEMAGYERPEYRDHTMQKMAGAMTSIGMSLSEFRAIDAETRDLGEGMRRLGDRLGLSRVTVHADDWAISATRGDPDQEREALMMGCLLASARAAAGGLSVPNALPDGAAFSAPPPEETYQGWHIVSCPSPHLHQPRTTLGLGDTFMAGCLLVLGQPKLPDLVMPTEAPMHFAAPLT
ncbi:ADP-dependent glucokinase/phosphofructokinase [Acidisoma silvae]|uniref:6-phosphofructokinase n=1 Tax=Acidisoma silvae TaxID=2802396 RepID=A0A963YV22_9PROT|nr:ADP-dependent glucokinase/phosphofructokinase [Acidisoma silvae]MCB8877534.1 hypothetical protein [Acidisoma silvae]